MLLKSLIVAGIIQGFFLILLLKTKRQNSDSDKLLMLWLGLMSLQLLFYHDNLSSSPIAYNFINLLGFSLPLLSSIILYLYIFCTSFNSKFQWKKITIHLVPYLLFNGIAFFFSSDIIVTNGFPHFTKNVPDWMVYLTTFQLAVIPGIYTILSLLVLLKYQKILPDNYSYTEKINLNWLKWVVLSLLVVFSGLFILIKFGVNLGIITYQNLFAVVGSIIAIYVYFIGYFGFRQSTIFYDIPLKSNFENTEETKDSYKKSGLSEEKVEAMFQKLLVHFEQNKPYLDENLSLTLLAQQIDLSPNQISQVINQKSSSNFFNFVNAYRVETVKERLRDKSYAHYSILAIGYDCGFQSKSSFNKVFKQMVGKTPVEYQKSVDV